MRKTFPEVLWQISLTSLWPELSLAGGHYDWLILIRTYCLMLDGAKSFSKHMVTYGNKDNWKTKRNKNKHPSLTKKTKRTKNGVLWRRTKRQPAVSSSFPVLKVNDSWLVPATSLAYAAPLAWNSSSKFFYARDCGEPSSQCVSKSVSQDLDQEPTIQWRYFLPQWINLNTFKVNETMPTTLYQLACITSEPLFSSVGL